jgi:predicted PurR-regulated permease PerM
VLTIVVHPVFIGLRRRGVPSWLAMTVMLLAVFGIAVSLAFSMGQLATLLPSYQSRFAMLVNEATAAFAEAGIGRDQVCAALSDLVFLLFGLIVAVLDGVAAWILGVPTALLWALAAFVIGLVPSALLVIAVYVVINFVIQSVVQPKFIGDAVDLLTSSKPAPAPQEG